MGKIKNLLQDDIKGEYGYDGVDDEYFYDKSKEVSMEEVIKNHDDWWDSLTEEEKQKIADEAQAASTYFDEQRANEALEQYRKDYDSFKSNTE